MIALLGAALGPAATAAAQWIEAQPNDACAQAELLTDAVIPLELMGSLLGTQPGDVDFVRFAAAPGQRLAVEAPRVQIGAEGIAELQLRAFDSSCSPLPVDPGFENFVRRLEIAVPADGIVILGVTGLNDDAFSGGHAEGGGYRIRVARSTSAGRIDGRLLDAASGLAVYDRGPGRHASVSLQACSQSQIPCRHVAYADIDSGGRFRFGDRLRLSTQHPYAVVVTASGYASHVVYTLHLEEVDESIDLGDIELSPTPLALGLVEACQVPKTGGIAVTVCAWPTSATSA